MGGWLDQVGIKLSQLSTKLKLKLKLSLAIIFKGMEQVLMCGMNLCLLLNSEEVKAEQLVNPEGIMFVM